MDLTTVDVTDIAGVAVGDRAVLLGEDGVERIGPEEMAERAETIHWEVLCGIGPRVPRLYLRRGRRVELRSRFA